MSIEILSPAGSFEALQAAVRAGADAVYLGAKQFSARANAANFDDEQLIEAVKYCHLYGVKVYVTLNILIKQKELDQSIDLLRKIRNAQVDGVIVQDLGIINIMHKYFPDLEIHGSTQMSIQDESVLPLLKENGFKRIVVAREMSKQELQRFCNKAKEYGIEVEYFVHGALCMSVSGQCLLSAMIGTRSGNRGQCAQPCRLPFAAKNGTGNDLSLKDSSLYNYVAEMESLGVASLKIEGRMKRPEYVALATYNCLQAVRGEKVDTQLLQDVFSRSGFTDGYYTSKLGRNMFGTRTKDDVLASKETFNKIHQLYRTERQNIALNVTVKASVGSPLEIVADDYKVKVTGENVLPVENNKTELQNIKNALAKLGNTPYYLENVNLIGDSDFFVPLSSLNQLRRELVEKLNEVRLLPLNRVEKEITLYTGNDNHKLTETFVRIADASQYPSEHVDGVIVPIDYQIDEYDEKLIVEIPRWINNNKYIRERLQYFASFGIVRAYCNNLAAVVIAKEEGFEVIGGSFLNIFNGESVELLQEYGVSSFTVSVELALKEIAEVETALPMGMITYGRIPLMLLRNCPLKNGRKCSECDHKGYLTDRMGVKFPVRCSFGMSELLNSEPVYMADKLNEIRNVDFQILYFTIESGKEVDEIIKAYRKKEKASGSYTRGLYYRSVI